MRKTLRGVVTVTAPFLLMLLACSDADAGTGSVTGTVRSTTGPIEAATVSLNPGAFTTETDSVGAYRFDGIEPGTYEVVASATGYQDSDPQSVEVKEGGRVLANLTLDPNPGVGHVVGLVTDSATGAPIEGATVATDPATPETTTDAAGEYALDLPAGEYVLQASAEGYHLGTSSSIEVSAGSTVTQDFSLVAIATYDSTCESCHLQESELLASLTEDPLPEDPGEGGSAGEG